MTIAQDNTRKVDRGVYESSGPRGLTAIHRPDCAAAIWDRRPLPRFQRWIDSISPEHLPRARLVLRADMVCEALANIVDVCGTPVAPERDLLADDASALAAIFANVMGTEYLRLRLDVIRSNACRKFHIDAVTARLVCTYRGTGTQYGVSTNGADPARIHTVRAGSPIILRGTHWPETPMAGLLHRSPPIEGRGETRLVFVLDPLADPADESERHFVH